MNRCGNIKSLKRICVAALAIAMLCSAVLSMFGCANKSTAESDFFAKLQKEGKKISVNAPITADKRDVFLFAIEPWEKADVIENREPLTKAKVKNREAKASLTIEEGQAINMLCKGYIFGMVSEDGKSYSPVSDVFYITNPKEIHEDGKKIDESALTGNLKGLVGTPSQLVELGASSTMITVDLGELLVDEGGDGTISTVWNSVSVHFDREVVEELDRKVKAFTEAGISVYFEIVQTYSYGALDGRIKNIVFEDAPRASAYALNMQNRDGFDAICGAFNLLAERYSGGDYGQVDSFVIGRDVNNFRSSYSSGLDTQAAISNYSTAVRMAYNLLIAHNPNGRVYIALGNNWSVSDTGSIGAKEMLISFTNLAEDGGDYFWQLSVSANASDSSNSSIWVDALATDSTQFITPANLEILSLMLSTSAYKCNGLERNLLLSHFSICGLNEDAQAASYAYAYYKALDSGKVNALIYDRAVDGENDSLRSGAYALGANGTPQSKKLTSVFESVDNGTVGDISYISTLIGEGWNNLYKPLAKEALHRNAIKGSSSSDQGKNELSVITSFDNGSYFGFTPISAEYVELRYADGKNNPSLYVSLDSEFTGDKAGAVTDKLSLDQIKKAGYLSITSKVDSDSADSSLTICLLGYDKSGKEISYTATTKIDSNEWVDMSYNIEEFLNHVDEDEIRLTVMAGSVDGNDPDGLWISRISTGSPDQKPFPMWAIWLLISVVIVGGLAGFVIWFRKNYTFVRE